ncbi:hypothetical protein AB0J52_18170, partial [Spirillospora sp. NPDC049652]
MEQFAPRPDPDRPDPDRPESNPYPGCRPFGEDERHRFFGRAKEARALADLWTHRPVTVLRGPSGCGRTSLI